MRNSVVGKRVTRVDALEKATGQAKFTGDLDFPEMLHAKAFRSPYAHARILKVDVKKAAKLSGVRAILTKENTPRIPIDWALDERMARYPFDDKVRYLGEAIAVVAATEEDIAERALELIEVEYGILPAVFEPEMAMKLGAPQVHATENNVCSTWEFEDGDLKKSYEEADYIFEDKYATPTTAHCCLEPRVSICSFDSLSGKMTVWVSTQFPHEEQQLLCRVLNLPISKVNVIVAPHVGGGFGSKHGSDLMVYCSLLSQKTGLPVKLENTREEEFYTTLTRHSCVAKLKTGVKKDGTLTARQGDFTFNTGAYADAGLRIPLVAGWAFSLMYRSSSLRYDGAAVFTNTPVAGAMRGFGRPQVAFAVESQIDSIAEELKMDPLKLRLRNLVQEGYTRPSLGSFVYSCGLKQCIELGAERIGWKKRKKLRARGARMRGVGMGINMQVSGLYNQAPEFSSCSVRINEDGTANFSTSSTDMGQGRSTTMAQIIAEELGIRLEDVNVIPADTNSALFEGGSHASRSTYVSGNSVKIAANSVKKQLFEEAALLLDVHPDDLEVRDRRIYVKGNRAHGISVTDVVRSARYGRNPREIVGVGHFTPSGSAWNFAATFAEVEVDTDTGQVKVSRVVSALDVGKVINRLGMEGQVEGSIHMGLGYALTEELIIGKTGVTLNPNFTDYKILLAPDMPKTDCVFAESIEPTGPFGAKGGGEVVLGTVAPAIANAIYDATGVRMKQIPITPGKVLRALARASLEPNK